MIKEAIIKLSEKEDLTYTGSRTGYGRNYERTGEHRYRCASYLTAHVP